MTATDYIRRLQLLRRLPWHDTADLFVRVARDMGLDPRGICKAEVPHY
ncbi:hypothetical protein [Methylorubrum populi]|nr:hypothetical protein [Methylorubrum populi]